MELVVSLVSVAKEEKKKERSEPDDRAFAPRDGFYGFVGSAGRGGVTEIEVCLPALMPDHGGKYFESWKQ